MAVSIGTIYRNCNMTNQVISQNTSSLPATLSDIDKHFDIDQLQVHRIAAQLLLTKLANREAVRLEKLVNFRDAIEEQLFDEDRIDKLTQDELIALHQLISSSESQAYGQIQKVSKDVNLEEVKVHIKILSQSMNDSDNPNLVDNSEAAAVAQRLLSQVEARK